MIRPTSLCGYAPTRIEFWATNSQVVAGQVNDVVTLFGPTTIEWEENCSRSSVFDQTFMHFPKAFTTYGIKVFEAGIQSRVVLSKIILWEINDDLDCCLAD